MKRSIFFQALVRKTGTSTRCHSSQRMKVFLFLITSFIGCYYTLSIENLNLWTHRLDNLVPFLIMALEIKRSIDIAQAFLFKKITRIKIKIILKRAIIQIMIIEKTMDPFVAQEEDEEVEDDLIKEDDVIEDDEDDEDDDLEEDIDDFDEEE